MDESGFVIQTYHIIIGAGLLAGGAWQVVRFYKTVREPVTKLEAKQVEQDAAIADLQRDVRDNKERLQESRKMIIEIKQDIRNIFDCLTKIQVSMATIETKGCRPIKGD